MAWACLKEVEGFAGNVELVDQQMCAYLADYILHLLPWLATRSRPLVLCAQVLSAQSGLLWQIQYSNVLR